EVMPRRATEAFGECLGVAVITARTNLGAASHRIPGGIRPLDGAVVAHPTTSTSPAAIHASAARIASATAAPRLNQTTTSAQKGSENDIPYNVPRNKSRFTSALLFRTCPHPSRTSLRRWWL